MMNQINLPALDPQMFVRFLPSHDSEEGTLIMLVSQRVKKTCKYRWKRYWINEGPKFVWVAIWLIGNIALFTANFIGSNFLNHNVPICLPCILEWLDENKPGVRLLGKGLAFSKSGAALIRLNTVLLLIMVARNFISLYV